jgi:hypothetical protein
METVINDGKVGNYKTINIHLKFKAWLGHDNKYFDRTCANRECPGMYDARQHQTCPKCGSQLTFITTSDNRPMGVSEGTFYPVLTQKQKERDSQRAMMRKGGTEKVYRFKMFSFGTGSVLAPPPAHAFCKKGALVEINIINHQSDASIFIAKGNIPKVEEMYHIFENYGDSVTLMSATKADEARIEYPVNAEGHPQVDPIFAHAANGGTALKTPDAKSVPGDVAGLKTQLEGIMAAINKLEGGAVTETPTEQPATVGNDEANPFVAAS